MHQLSVDMTTISCTGLPSADIRWNGFLIKPNATKTIGRPSDLSLCEANRSEKSQKRHTAKVSNDARYATPSEKSWAREITIIRVRYSCARAACRKLREKLNAYFPIEQHTWRTGASDTEIRPYRASRNKNRLLINNVEGFARE